MPWADTRPGRSAEGTDADAAAERVRARTHLTIVITDLELAHRMVAKAGAVGQLDAAVSAALLEITTDAIRSADVLAEGLRVHRAEGEKAEPVTAGEAR